MEFKDIFKALREDKKLSQAALATKLGVSKAVISFWETGRNEPTLQMIKKICMFFDVDADVLIGLKDN